MSGHESRTPPAAAAGGWRRSFWQQFSRPKGAWGWLVGHLMAIKNRERSEWLMPLLNVQPNDRVLEIGFGPGVDVRRVSTAAPGVQVAGIDHSEEMLRQARKRNAAAVREGRVDLRLGPAFPLPFAAETFDRAFSVNTVQFWPDRAVGFAELRRVLKPGGLLAVAIQPRNLGATAETTREWGQRLSAELQAAGFSQVRLEFKEMRPVPVVCALGTR
jgi:ubiquinone/menaquinone biosynthesis C-methylase UbiE